MKKIKLTLKQCLFMGVYQGYDSYGDETDLLCPRSLYEHYPELRDVKQVTLYIYKAPTSVRETVTVRIRPARPSCFSPKAYLPESTSGHSMYMGLYLILADMVGSEGTCYMAAEETKDDE